MFNTNSQVTVVSYMYCYISIRLNLISKVIIGYINSKCVSSVMYPMRRIEYIMLIFLK